MRSGPDSGGRDRPNRDLSDAGGGDVPVLAIKRPTEVGSSADAAPIPCF